MKIEGETAVAESMLETPLDMLDGKSIGRPLKRYRLGYVDEAGIRPSKLCARAD